MRELLLRSGCWRAEPIDGVVLVRCTALPAGAAAHAFSTRRVDASSDFDLGSADPESPQVLQRRVRFLRAAGIRGTRPTVLRQVHGAELVRAAAVGPQTQADAVLWLSGDPCSAIPAVRTADCVPILLQDSPGAAVAAVHAGWRGTAAEIARRAVEALVELGVSAGDLHATIGPAIGRCCYEVGEEVVETVAAACGVPEEAICSVDRGRSRLDLAEANRLQLREAGLPSGAIQVCPWCTACMPGWFFSHRRQGVDAGRMMASIGPAEAPRTALDS